MTEFAIFYESRELARELGDPQLGTVEARNKAEAEELARKDGDIVSRAMPTASLWAVEIKPDQAERGRA